MILLKQRQDATAVQEMHLKPPSSIGSLYKGGEGPKSLIHIGTASQWAQAADNLGLGGVDLVNRELTDVTISSCSHRSCQGLFFNTAQ